MGKARKVKAMQFLVITSDNGAVNWNDHAACLKEEAFHVWKLYKVGIIRSLWFTEQKDAVLLLEADAKEEAERTVEEFPLIKNKLITYSMNLLFPYTGIERIINGSN